MYEAIQLEKVYEHVKAVDVDLWLHGDIAPMRRILKIYLL